MVELAPDIIAAAQSAQAKYDILPSVQLGQFGLESAWGAKTTGAFNFFGIKGGAGVPSTLCTTHEEIGGKLVQKQCLFRDFASAADAFSYHAALLMTGLPYRAAWPLRHDCEAYVKAIAPHYATDPEYADKLLEVIRSENLQRFDVAPPTLAALSRGAF